MTWILQYFILNNCLSVISKPKRRPENVIESISFRDLTYIHNGSDKTSTIICYMH